MCVRSKLVSSANMLVIMIARQMKISSSIESLTRRRVNVPGGFVYGAFNGVARIKPWSILRMVDASRAAVFTPTEDGVSFLDVATLYNKYLFFILASSLHVKKEFYDLDLVKAPVSIDVELKHVGKTSFLLKSSGFVGDVPEPLFISRVTSVFVCNETRKTKPPPECWLEKFSKEIPIRSKPLERLDMGDSDDFKSTTSHCTVQAADVDGYLHTNWANYVRFCSNAFVERLIATTNVESPADIFREVSDMSIVYKKQSSIGDVLMTRVMPHSSDSNTFYFSVSKAHNVVCECKLKYHPF